MAALKTTGTTEVMSNLRPRWLPDRELPLNEKPEVVSSIQTRHTVSPAPEDADAVIRIDPKRLARIVGDSRPESQRSGDNFAADRVGIGMSYDCPSCRRRTEIYWQNPLDGRKPPLRPGQLVLDFDAMPIRSSERLGGIDIDRAVDCISCHYRHEIIGGLVERARPGR